MRACARALAAILAIGAAAPDAAACGACIEDKVAATFDYAVITKAAKRHHVVVFAEFAGDGGAAVALEPLRAAAARAPGVDPASVRASGAPQALSFALDPAVSTPQAALAVIERGTRGTKVKLTLLRTM